MRIEKLDNFGRGITYVDDKITFVENALPKEDVEIKLTKKAKKFNEGVVTKYNKVSPNRVEAKCLYFKFCGGCNLSHLSYKDTISFKKERLENILSKYAKINRNIEVVASPKKEGYRNKITLQVKNGKIGYFANNTHKLIEIDNCLLACKQIQNIIKDLKYLNVINGQIILRCNNNDELLIVINTKDKCDINIDYLKEYHKIVGIVLNDKVIYGESKFVELVANNYYQVSYDSFFQINRDICAKIFEKIKSEIECCDTVLDLYCGVGSLGIATHANKIYGIEVIKNAVVNANINAKINKIKEYYYMLGKVENVIDKINDKIDVVIVDPPRSGLDKKSIEVLLNLKPKKIIYVSCDVMTLARDLNTLKKIYNIKDITGFDMFAYTYHVECVCLLKLK